MQQHNAESKPDTRHFERAAREEGYSRIAGVDEVGRGPLAGPVVAVAVVLPEACLDLPLNDSKSLSAKKRDELADQLRRAPGIQIGIGCIPPAEIDRLNILRATHAAMRTALLGLVPSPEFALVDGLHVPGLPVPARFIVKGDARSATIAAASIIAKVYRDRLMVEMDARHPGYGFAQHKGYATREHLRALRELGPSPIHRQSFAPVARAQPGTRIQMNFTFGENDT